MATSRMVGDSKIVVTTMRADRFTLNTSHTQTTVHIVVNVAQVQTMRFIGASVFQHSTAAGNTWWTTGVATN
ncbi:hypothetical protein [Rhodoferax ferrireducens]|uniref:hypothetical protein n=1 Tax=Rhodoferax ferrireducens TaxID=192843 RepID=UPI003851337C